MTFQNVVDKDIDVPECIEIYRKKNDKEAAKNILSNALEDIYKVCTHAFKNFDVDIISDYFDFALEFYLRKIEKGTFLNKFKFEQYDERQWKSYITWRFKKGNPGYYDFLKKIQTVPHDYPLPPDYLDESKPYNSLNEFYGEIPFDKLPYLKTQEDIYISILQEEDYKTFEERINQIEKITKLLEDKVRRNIDKYTHILYGFHEKRVDINGTLKEICNKIVNLKDTYQKEYCEFNGPILFNINNDMDKIQKSLIKQKRLRDKYRIELNKCEFGHENEFCCKFLNTTKNNFYAMKSRLKTKLKALQESKVNRTLSVRDLHNSDVQTNIDQEM